MSNRNRTIVGVAVGAVVIVFAVLVLTSVGGGNGDAAAKQTDGAFITGMIPHHNSAVAMAKIAETKGEHPQVKQLARDIVAAQTSEIDELSTIHLDLFDSAPPADGSMHGDLGMSMEDMGMDMNPADLNGATPFDREFIDMMIPHHQGAIRMARVEMDRGEDKRLLEMSMAIVRAQSKEIREMNRWRKAWYGATSPAGGVPTRAAAPVAHS